MDDTKLQWMPVGLERFSHLENRISQTVGEIKAIRQEADALRGENLRLNERVGEKIRENESLRDEISKLTAQLAEQDKLRAENDSLRQQVATLHQTETETLDMLAQFEREREEFRDRVEKTLTLLTSLEK